MKWIKVKDRKPEKSKEVLIVTKHKAFCVAFYNGLSFILPYFEDSENWESLDMDYVTHWMPLPEPPKEDFADDYIMPKKTDHRKQRGRTAPNRGKE